MRLRGRTLGGAVGAVLVVALGASGPASAGVPVAASADDRAPVVGVALGAPTVQGRAGMPTSVAALGDSITAGFNACGFYSDCRPRSWSTGEDAAVYSHRQRLEDAGAELAGVHNLARTGARVEALPAQMAAAADAGADYATVEIGANDACRRDAATMTSVAAFGGSVREAFATLRTERPDARMFVASVPDLHRLWEVGHGSRFARTAWKKLDICQSMLARPTSTSAADRARRAAVRERVQAYNGELAAACAEFGPRCRWDGGAVFGYRFSLNQLTRWDYFHPDKGGQRALADATWRASFFS